MVRHGVVGTGPPVVVVHGTPWSSFNMRHLIEPLSREFAVHYYDMVGYGQSDKGPGDVSLGIQDRLLVRLIAHWGLSDPCVIGHDFGGATVLRAHCLGGQGFSRIVLVDPVAISPWGSAFFRHVRQHEQAFAGVPDYIHEAIVRAYIGTAAHRSLDERTLAATVAPWLGRDGRAAFYRQIAQADAAYTDTAQPLYEQIERPVLVLWGEEDTWIPVDRGHALTAMIPGARLHVVPGCGHLVIEERPERLLDQIVPFLHDGRA